MTAKSPLKGRKANRSAGTVADYLRCISEGMKLEAIGAQYGVTHAAVQIALKRAGLPTCARKYLEALNS